MDEGDGHGAFTDGGGDTFHGGGADVPSDKDPGMTGSRKNGGRCGNQAGESLTVGPVLTNPLSSVSISLGSQSVCGMAPINGYRVPFESCRCLIKNLLTTS